MPTRIATKRKGLVRPTKPLLALYENHARCLIIGELIYIIQKDPFMINDETLAHMDGKGWLTPRVQISEDGILECTITDAGKEVAENYIRMRNNGLFQQELEFGTDVLSIE